MTPMLIPQERYGSVIVPFNRKNHLIRSVETYVLLDAGGLGQWHLLLSACVRLCCAEVETEGFGASDTMEGDGPPTHQALPPQPP